MKILYSALTNAFYAEVTINVPSDAVEISNAHHIELLQKQAEGLAIVADKNGYPINVEAPHGQFWRYDGEKWIIPNEFKEAFKQEKIEQNKIIKLSFLSQATEKINILQDELDLDMSDDIDTTEAKLKAWKKCRIMLNRVDVEQEDLVFPSIPE